MVNLKQRLSEGDISSILRYINNSLYCFNDFDVLKF